MNSLDDFEKSVAAGKAEHERAAQEKKERRDRKNRHHHHRSDRHRASDRKARDRSPDRHHEHRRSRKNGPHGDDRASKRVRHSRNDEDSHLKPHKQGPWVDPKDLKRSDPREDHSLPNDGREPDETDRDKPLVRDSWMTAPSALDVDYVQRRTNRDSPSRTQRKEIPPASHGREINAELAGSEIAQAKGSSASGSSGHIEASYRFGDEGSHWRMTKLKRVYTTAEQSGHSVEDVALESYGGLRDFDDAREEEMELDRRSIYGSGFIGKVRPSGELHKQRIAKIMPAVERKEKLPPPEQGVVVQGHLNPMKGVDQTTLNRMRAQLLKAKIRKAPNVLVLEAEYEAAAASFQPGATSDSSIVLDASHSRMLAGPRAEVKAVNNKRGRNRGAVEANEEMSVDDMVREERRTKNQTGGEGMRLAERIAKDAKFTDDLEYLDEASERLARRIHKSESSLKGVAISEFNKLNRILDTCPLCYHEDRQPPDDQPAAPIISIATRVFLTLTPEPELTGAEGGAVIVPLSHHTNLLECDDDEWEEMRNFMKSLTRLFHDQGREVLFYENAAAPQRRKHATLVAVPIPYDQGDMAPAFFREAMLSADEEWAQHEKIIDTGKSARDGMGKLAFRRSLAKEMPYFHVWFTLDGGLGHIVEDAERWPRGDLFAREVIGGMLDCEPAAIKQQGRWSRNDGRVEEFKKRWRKFDWTRLLTEGTQTR